MHDAASPAPLSSQPAAAHAFTTAAIALQARPPWLVARMVSMGICVMVLLGLLFAWWAKVDVVVSAQGRVIPAGKSKVVQSLEPGVVRSISVRDGQSVRAGEVLLELDPTTTGADLQRLQRESWEHEADVQRLTAQLAGRSSLAMPPELPADIRSNQEWLLAARLAEQRSRVASLEADVARRRAESTATASHLRQLEASLPLVRRKHDMRTELAKTGHIAETGVIEAQLELQNVEKEMAVQGSRLVESAASLRAAEQQVAQAAAEFRARTSSELAEAARRREAATQELVKARQRRDLQVLRAPIDGVVQQLAVTTVGGVVTAAQPLLTVVPANASLEVEAQVINRDVGHVRVGQRVINKLETYDFTRYGYIEGNVEWVGTDAVVDPKLGPVYPVRIRLHATETPKLVRGHKGSVSAGMSVTSDIRTAERRLIEYFIAPMLRYRDESLRER